MIDAFRAIWREIQHSGLLLLIKGICGGLSSRKPQKLPVSVRWIGRISTVEGDV